MFRRSTKAVPVVLAFAALQLGCGGRSPAVGDSIEMKIVAHYDDDLLFMNPDLAESIQLGKRVRTVFLTAGDAGKPSSYWGNREAGILEAYAAMAGAPNKWQSSALPIAGRGVQLRTLEGNHRVSVVLLRLPDGNSHGQGFKTKSGESLAKLWAGKIALLHPLDGSTGLSKSDLIDLITALMEDFQPQTVDTQDWTGQFKKDHSDHVHAGLFAHAAIQNYSRPHMARVYRGYNFVDDPLNLSASQQVAKERFFIGYAKHDSDVCRPGLAKCKAYETFLGRQYPFIPGTLVGPGGKCLQVGDDLGDGEDRVSLSPCRDVVEQKWTMTGRQMKSALGLCLSEEVLDKGGPMALIVAPCDGSREEKWSFTKEGHLKAWDGSCAMFANIGATRGTDLLAGDCGEVPEQRWRLYKQ